LREESGKALDICYGLIQVIKILVEQGQLEAAQQYEQQLLTYREQLEGAYQDYLFRFIRALMLKTSPRTRNKMKAQEIFQQLAEENVINFEWTIQANLHLCELFFFEFKSSEAPEILQEIHTLTNRLLDQAKAQNSHSLLAETYVLQAKLALLELDVPHARRLFTQAQTIAEEKGLEKLAKSISHEHDLLLKQEANQDQKDSLGQKLSEVGDTLSRMSSQRAPVTPDPVKEVPVLLLIFGAESGLSVFSKQFRPKAPLDEHRIAGFLTAMNAFGEDAFAAGPIERIMYADYTVLLRPVAPFLMCYVIQGDSYYALQKFTQFVTDLHTLSSAWESLIEVTKVGRGPLVRAQLSLVDELATEIFQSYLVS
jgi:hypothetical protein